MIYKTFFSTIFLALLCHIVIAQSVEFEIRYNASGCYYEAVAHVISAPLQGDDLFAGPSGFTVVMPEGTNGGTPIARPFMGVDNRLFSLNGGSWEDTDPAYGVSGLDYHKFATTGGSLGNTTYNPGDEILLFVFTLYEENCASSLRVFNNGIDVNPTGNTYENSFQTGPEGQNSEKYAGNINNDAIILPAPTPDPSSECTTTDINLKSNLDANYASCDDVTFSWSGPASFTSSIADPSFTITDSEAQSGDYMVTISDRNGCVETRTIAVDAVACSSLAVPVTMSSFDASKNGDYAFLDWTTESELNNLHFEVESSSDGKNFDKIGVVIGSGTTSENTTYDFTDRKPYSGINFYRLKQVDLNGEYEYSDVRTLDFRGDNDFYVFPNPASDHIVIKTTKEFQEDSKFQLFNELGQLVKSGNVANNQNVSIVDINNGMYVIRIVGKSQNILFNQKINILR